MWLRGLIITLCIGAVISVTIPIDCPQCDHSKCPRSTECVNGKVWDRCYCCRICGLAEGELCDASGKTSKCGVNMTCEAVNPFSRKSHCVCNYKDELCGSDDTTYRNMCHLREVKSTEKPHLYVKQIGPCKHKPILISGPEHSANRTGGYIALSCEAGGHPIPMIDWIYTRGESIVKHLPGDSVAISVNLRGGPARRQITGWLQIQGLMKEHEGYYTCVAHNDEGKVEGVARVMIEN